jgi:hypothetical protein
MLRFSAVKWLSVLAVCAVALAARAEEWLPVNPDELKMTSEPKAPTAPAIYLYRQVDRNDEVSYELVYARIKILTEEGRAYGDVQIAYTKGRESIRSIEARTIRPDGSIVNFDGTIFEKPIVQGRGVKYLAKTFTLPDVQVGSIIEYRYRRNLQDGYVFDSHWIVSEELFTKHAKFSLVPSSYFKLRYSWPAGLPPGTTPPTRGGNRKVLLETRDVEPFITEDHMPPERQLKYRVDFVYISDGNDEKDEIAFWKRFGKQAYRQVEDFADKPRVMEQAVAEIVNPRDSPEMKLRKIYARTQELRNSSFERSKTEEEVKREAQKEAANVGDVWKRGNGDASQITSLFLALARAAGFKADTVFVSTRDTYFFDARMMNPSQLNSSIVVVKLDGKDLFLDPGMAFAPFGLLPWSETAVKGLRLTKEGGEWITTPIPDSSQSRTIRKAKFKLSADGSLVGTVRVTYTGLEALWRRLTERHEDDTDRIEFMESQIEWDIPSGSNVKLTNTPAWDGSDLTLTAEYTVDIPGWASRAGQRTLLTVGVFGNSQKHTFEHATRVHPLYFNFPSEVDDDIVIELPAGWQAESVPAAHRTDTKTHSFHLSVENNGSTLHVERELMVDLLLVDRKFYPTLREFFQTVRTHDEQQVVIGASKPPARR